MVYIPKLYTDKTKEMRIYFDRKLLPILMNNNEIDCLSVSKLHKV